MGRIVVATLLPFFLTLLPAYTCVRFATSTCTIARYSLSGSASFSSQGTIAGYYVDGKRVRRFFTSKEKATDFVEKLRIKKDNLGTRALGIDPSIHIMTIECEESLAPYGKTIADATNFYRKHLEIVQRSCRIDEL